MWGENCPSLRMKIIIVLVRGGEVERHILQGGGDEGDEKEGIEWLGVKY